MGEFNYYMEGELHLVEDGKTMISSFNRDHIMVYIGMREAGLSHGQASFKMCQMYGYGGGPRPRFFHVDEVELMDPQTWEESRGR